MLLQLADVVDNEAMQVYMKPSSHEESKAPSKGFVVRDAPWATVNNEKVSAACAAGWGHRVWGQRALSLLGGRESSFLLLFVA